MFLCFRFRSWKSSICDVIHLDLLESVDHTNCHLDGLQVLFLIRNQRTSFLSVAQPIITDSLNGLTPKRTAFDLLRSRESHGEKLFKRTCRILNHLFSDVNAMFYRIFNHVIFIACFRFVRFFQ